MLRPVLRYLGATLVIVLSACADPVDPPPTEDAGARDTGVGRDAAVEPDGGVDPDSGVEADSGAADTGTADAAAADVADVGPSDAGDPRELLPYSNVHANAVRLDDRHLAVAYSEDADPSVAPDHFLIRVVERTDDRFAIGAPNLVPIPLIAPLMDQGLKVFGALGPDHFVIVTEAPGFDETLHWFRRDGFTVALVGSQALGATERPGGHPVDDQRYLLRYRPGDSAQPVRYQLLLRTGDEVRLGAMLVRPGPDAFLGLDPNEPQSFGPLARLSPYAFREVRPGYVYAPGYLSSFQLTVDPTDDSLAISNLQVHTGSGQRTMEPLVAADGLGAIVTLYRRFEDDGAYGYFDASGAYVDQGPLDVGAPTFQAQSRDSTDSLIEGRLYLRSQPGVLYRFDTPTAPAAVEATDLPWSFCTDAPSVLRSGRHAVLLVCDGTGPLRLETLPL